MGGGMEVENIKVLPIKEYHFHLLLNSSNCTIYGALGTFGPRGSHAPCSSGPWTTAGRLASIQGTNQGRGSRCILLPGHGSCP